MSDGPGLFSSLWDSFVLCQLGGAPVSTGNSAAFDVACRVFWLDKPETVLPANDNLALAA